MSEIIRRVSKAVHAGNVTIGGNAPVSVQSMTNIAAHDFEGILDQVRTLEKAGCDIVRLAVPDTDAAGIFAYLKKNGVALPLVADIHFDYRIALEALRNGADKIRINPGNIGQPWKVRQVADACKSEGTPIRIGVNSGSLDKRLLEKYGAPTAQALAESALEQAGQLEDFGFSDTVISIKSSNLVTMMSAARLVAENSSYPLHLGVTEAGGEYPGLVKNSIGIGSLLAEGIGDTLRVSLTADPVREIAAGREILNALGISRHDIDIISCPTCGRTRINLIDISERFRQAAQKIDTKGKKLTVAVMGCAVNGPGEAREADFGIAGGDGCAVLFRRGQIVGKIDEDKILDALIEETVKFIG